MGEIFEAVRRAENLTQNEFSESLNVVQSTISKLEKSVFIDVPFDLVSTLSLKYEIKISDFQKCYITRSINKYPSLNSHKFFKNGHIKSRTIFFLLEYIEKEIKKDIYKCIGFKRSLLAFEKLKLSLLFLKIIDKNIHMHLTEVCSDLIDTLPKNKLNGSLHEIFSSYKWFEFDMYSVEGNGIISIKNSKNKDFSLMLNILCLEICLEQGQNIFGKITTREDMAYLELIDD